MHDDWTNLDLAALRGPTAFTRREILMTSLAAGFALAVQPVSAQTITTDTEGLTAGEVKIPVADGEIPAYRAMPAKGGHFPVVLVVLVVQEIFGVHEHIKDLCRRYAKAGYLPVAPELYARQGDVSKISDWKQTFADVVSKVPDAQVMSDLDAAAAKQPSEIVVFPDAQHGFLADYRPSYNEKAAKEGWTKCLAWFRGHGVG